MAHTDKEGNKLPQQKIHKTVFAKNCRIKRAQAKRVEPDFANGKYCPDCGFRKRGADHANGMHCKNTVPVHAR